jgi:hypothetical protein
LFVGGHGTVTSIVVGLLFILALPSRSSAT